MTMDVQRQNPWLSATMTRMDLAALQAFFDYRIAIAMAITFTFYKIWMIIITFLSFNKIFFKYLKKI